MKPTVIVVFMLGGIALLARTMQDPGSLSYPLLYPQLLLIAILALFAVLLIQVLREHRAVVAEGDEPEGFHASRIPAIGLAICVVYVAAWNVIGHLLSTVLFVFAMLMVSRERNVWILLGMCIVLPVVIWFVFGHLLSVPLPQFEW